MSRSSRHSTRAARRDDRTEGLSAYEKIREVVSRIPHGRVATYGQIAFLAGLGKRARMVGYALHCTPEHYQIPWHRVINAQGRISFPADSPAYRRQRDRLIAEDIPLVAGRVDLRRYRWRPGMEDAPEGYFEC